MSKQHHNIEIQNQVLLNLSLFPESTASNNSMHYLNCKLFGSHVERTSLVPKRVSIKHKNNRFFLLHLVQGNRNWFQTIKNIPCSTMIFFINALIKLKYTNHFFFNFRDNSILSWKVYLALTTNTLSLSIEDGEAKIFIIIFMNN